MKTESVPLKTSPFNGDYRGEQSWLIVLSLQRKGLFNGDYRGEQSTSSQCQLKRIVGFNGDYRGEQRTGTG